MSQAGTVSTEHAYPTLDRIRQTTEKLAGSVLRTPVWQWQTGVIAQQLSPQTQVWTKLELFQKTGTFKLRGALNCIESLDAQARQRGVVACSAGNHAMAVAYAAKLAGVSVRVVMPRHASPARVAACERMGADVLLTGSIHDAFAETKRIAEEEARTVVHPFEGPRTAEGTAGVGLELMQQVPDLDAVIVPVGGGGLIAGVAAAVKQLNPSCQVYGVEPMGADAMYRSFQSGQLEQLDAVDTIADSLGAPYTLAYSAGVCRRFVDEIVRVSDDALCQAMYHLFSDLKLVTEPASAAATAALLGPLRERLNGRRVGLVVCGTNIDAARFAELVKRGQQLLG